MQNGKVCFLERLSSLTKTHFQISDNEQVASCYANHGRASYTGDARRERLILVAGILYISLLVLHHCIYRTAFLVIIRGTL